MEWKELKEFCNSLTEEQLSKQVILWREEEAIIDISASCLEEDHYMDTNEPENGCMPESEAKSMIDVNPGDYPNGMDEFKKVYDKGDPLLHENF